MEETNQPEESEELERTDNKEIEEAKQIPKGISQHEPHDFSPGESVEIKDFSLGIHISLSSVCRTSNDLAEIGVNLFDWVMKRRKQESE